MYSKILVRLDARIRWMKARVAEINERIELETSYDFKMYLMGRRDELEYQIQMLNIDLTYYKEAVIND